MKQTVDYPILSIIIIMITFQSHIALGPRPYRSNRAYNICDIKLHVCITYMYTCMYNIHVHE